MRALCEATAGTVWVRALWLLGMRPQSPFCQCAPMAALWQQWVVQLSPSLLRQTLLVLREEVHILHMGKWYLPAIRKIWNQMELRLNDWFLFNDNNEQLSANHFCKTNTQCARTHHLQTYTHVDIHKICGHRRGLPRFVERPIWWGKSWAGFWTQTQWGDFADWQAVNFSQMEQRNWMSIHLHSQCLW